MTIVGIIKWLTCGLLHGRCQTCCIGDGDSCNTNDAFDNMNSVKMISDVMFKCRIINPAVGIFIMILINQMVCYNKTNPKILPAMLLFNHLLRSMSKVKGQGGKNNDPVTDDFTLFDRNH